MSRALLALMFVACGPSATVETDPPDTDVVDTDTDPPLLPVWRDGVDGMLGARCAPCHTSYAFGDLQVGSREELVDVPSSNGMGLVTPGSLEQSYLWHKVQDTHLEVGGAGERMPLDVAPLDTSETGLLSEWILAGAPLE